MKRIALFLKPISHITHKFVLFLVFKPSFDKNPLPSVFYTALKGNTTLPCNVEAAPLPTVRLFLLLFHNNNVNGSLEKVKKT